MLHLYIFIVILSVSHVTHVANLFANFVLCIYVGTNIYAYNY